MMNLRCAYHKGQAATEYIIILSIVVIIALIIVGLLRGVLELRTGFQTAKSRIEWASSDVVLIAHTIYSNGTITMIVVNNINYPIRISGLGLDEQPISYPGPTLYPGQESTINFYSNKAKGDPGDSYTHELYIRYTHAQEPSIRNTVNGMIYGVIEPTS